MGIVSSALCKGGPCVRPIGVKLRKRWRWIERVGASPISANLRLPPAHEGPCRLLPMKQAQWLTSDASAFPDGHADADCCTQSAVSGRHRSADGWRTTGLALACARYPGTVR